MEWTVIRNSDIKILNVNDSVVNGNFVWDLDSQKAVDMTDVEKAKDFFASMVGKENTTRFNVGDEVFFMTGLNNDISARARIKAIDGDDIYVYNDCYWFPIRDTERYKITAQAPVLKNRLR